MTQNMNDNQNRSEKDQRGTLRAALRLLGEIERAKSLKESAERQINSLAQALEGIILELPELDGIEFKKRLDEIYTPNQLKVKSGDINSNIIYLFKQGHNREWTIPEIHTEINKDGAQIDMKSLYNSVNYLAATGKLRRVSRGRYIISGIGASLDLDDFREDGTNRATEHDS
jgi:hypothetical protein